MNRFPIFNDRELPVTQRGWIPLDAIAPHDAQAKRNHGGQSLSRLAERGGLDAMEAVAVLEDADYRKRWPTMPDDREGRNAVLLQAAKRLDELCPGYIINKSTDPGRIELDLEGK